MRVRELKAEDVPILKRHAEATEFPYPDFDDPHVEAFLVVVDSEDRPIVACAAKRLIELYGYFDPNCSPSLRMKAMGMLHEGMAVALRTNGYNTASVGIHPRLAKTFGRRLERSFGWLKNTFDWWSIRF
jgi:hypothetical protein